MLTYCVFLGCNDGNYETINIKASEYTNKIYKLIIEDTNLQQGETRSYTFKLDDNNILHLSYSLNESNYNIPGVPDGSIVHKNLFELLQETINSKNYKYNTYKQKCDKCFLLIVSDNLAGNSSFLEFDDTIKNIFFKTNFDKIFLYEFGGKVHSISRELNIEKS